MKKAYIAGYILSVCFCVTGIGFRDRLTVLDILLVLLGVAVFLLTFVRHCFSKAKRCPNCGAMIHTGHIRTISRQQDGTIQCEKCGTLVRVNHSKG